uniref:Integrator complex subunit 11 n=1 Tax=Parascaris univalens TaxID=6257 RepID=A0A914ZI74_PARUN
MPFLKVTPLGAGQDVGRSCILLSIGGKNVMLDCGMHMGYQDERRFPDFNYISGGVPLTDFLHCVIISHFHLDHCGALPYMTEMIGYEGPIYMTYPTKAIAPVLLEDFRKVQTEFRGETNFFTSQMIKTCMRKVTPVNVNEEVNVDDKLSIQAFYAGHVLGAAMFLIKVGSESVIYTGKTLSLILFSFTSPARRDATRCGYCPFFAETISNVNLSSHPHMKHSFFLYYTEQQKVLYL